MALEPIFRVADLRAIEAAHGEAPLMERAGLAAATRARELLDDRRPRVLVLAGPGNNGGDAFVVARYLKSWFFDVVVAFCGDAAKLSRDAAAAYRAWREAGGETVTAWPDRDDWGLVVDGLFGIGLSRTVEGLPAQWIAQANASGAPILALDIASGLNADTGVAYAPAIRAHATATFIALKPGLLTADGPDYCGAISVHRLGLELDVKSSGRRLEWNSLAVALPQPLLRTRRNVHKGTFGTLGIVGGNDGLVGAAILAGRAAVHLGAGKVWVGLAASERPAVDWVQPELMLRQAHDVLSSKPDALLVGPGLGTTTNARELLAQALALDCPLAVDADALNLIAGDAALGAAMAKRSAPSAITPHPAEAARLAGATSATIQSDRLQAALDLAARFKASVVLKGAGSVIAHPDGSWAINASGNAALASGGTGDVLAGMLAALIVQNVPMEPALELAACLHGAAADALVADGVGPVGVTASELMPVARRLLNAAAQSGAPR
ncbi:MAG TPA: NAD(P)H-hydrate dehydratase [Casimicrobiaceae bacterium]|nr:NAD(P)H-hydrate dehydratase [Casimicrobiaceae bacterium]